MRHGVIYNAGLNRSHADLWDSHALTDNHDTPVRLYSVVKVVDEVRLTKDLSGRMSLAADPGFRIELITVKLQSTKGAGQDSNLRSTSGSTRQHRPSQSSP